MTGSSGRPAGPITRVVERDNATPAAEDRQKETPMSVLPDARIKQIEWFEQRLDAWTADPAAIGLSPMQVAQLASEIIDARTNYEAAQQARNESRSATVGFHASTETLLDNGRDLITTIKAFAEARNDPGVYVRAAVPPPADPGPLPAPGTPDRFRVALQGDGSLALAWHADNPAGSSGTIYEVWRSDAGGPMLFLGTTGTKRFHDTTLPAGTATAVYQITGVRSTRRGEPARFLVSLGTTTTTADNSSGNGGGGVDGDGDAMHIAA